MDSLDANLSELKLSLSKHPAVLEYLKNSILPVKEHFVIAWASHFPHLRNLNTSHVKSGHAFIKIFISTSSGDLLSVWKSLCHAVDHQITHVHQGIGKDSIKTLTNIPRSFFRLPQKISKHAILEAQKQFKILEKKDLTEPCSRTFYEGSGIPCSHMIGQRLKEHADLEPDDFHSQWCLDYNPECSVSLIFFLMIYFV